MKIINLISEKSEKMSSFKKLLISYVIMATVLFVISNLISFLATSALRDTYVELIENDFKKSINIFESKIEELDRIDNILLSEDDIIYLSNIDSPSTSDYYVMNRVIELTGNYEFNNRFVNSISLYFTKSEMLKLDGSFITPEGDWGKSIYKFNQNDYVEFYSNSQITFPQTPYVVVNVASAESQHNRLYYINPVYNSSLIRLYEISTQELNLLFDFFDEGIDGHVEVTNQDGVLLYTNNANASSDTFDNTTVIHNESTASDLRFDLYIPEDYFVQRMSGLNILITLINIVFLLSCIVLSLLFAKKNSNSIKAVLGKLSLENKGQNEYELIYQAVEQIKRENNDYSHQIEENNSVLGQIFSSKGELLFYPLNVEDKIINTISNCDTEETEKILNKLLEDNFNETTDKEVEKNLLIQLAIELKVTLERVITRNSLKNVEFRETALDYSSINSLVSDFILKAKVLSEKLKEEKEIKFKMELETVREYIDNNYCSFEMSLSSVAEKFSYSESHLSKLFKEIHGCTFSAYLENLRLKKAMQLVENENYSFVKISENCGYININSFYKAFKRFYGAPPGTFRKQQK